VLVTGGSGMKLNKNIGMILLAIYLILIGVAHLVNLGNLMSVLPYLALVAGIFILLGK
jgi:hypothetical protein